MKRIMLLMMTLACLLQLAACRIGILDFDEEETVQSGHAQQTAIPAQSPSAKPTGTAAMQEGLEITLRLAFGERTGVYSGEMMDGLPHGQGTFSTQNEEGTGWVYEGSWEMGHMRGQGTTAFESGYRETGWYENDNLNGQGSLYQDDLLTYEGLFTDNIPNGQGTLYSLCGEVIFSGNFSDGFIDETQEARAERLGFFREGCETRDYAELMESAQNGGGLKAKLSGTVYYVYEADEFGYDIGFILDMPDGNIVYVSYRLSVGETSVKTGKKVTVWGVADYPYAYRTDSGAEAAIPLIEAWDVMDVSGTIL